MSVPYTTYYLEHRGQLYERLAALARIADETPLNPNEARALLNILQRWERLLLRLAARADDYSGPDVRAHVADALGLTLAQLDARLGLPKED